MMQRRADTSRGVLRGLRRVALAVRGGRDHADTRSASYEQRVTREPGGISTSSRRSLGCGSPRSTCESGIAPLVLTVDLPRHDGSPEMETGRGAAARPFHPSSRAEVAPSSSTTRCAVGCARRGGEQRSLSAKERPDLLLGRPGPSVVLGCSRVLVLALGDLDEMVAELRLHGTVHYADLLVEADIVELLDHLAGGELAQSRRRAAQTGRSSSGLATSAKSAPSAICCFSSLHFSSVGTRMCRACALCHVKLLRYLGMSTGSIAALAWTGSALLSIGPMSV